MIHGNNGVGLQPEEIVRGVRLPRTAGRASVQSFAKLLNYVDPDAHTGFGFEGKFMLPGKTVTEAELCPPEYPATPILLEYAGPVGGARGHKRNEYLYILWRYEREENVWAELGRSQSVSWEWTHDLGPIAIRALREARGPVSAVEVMANLVLISGQISVFLDTTLRHLDHRDRARVLAVLHDQFASRLVASTRNLP